MTALLMGVFVLVFLAVWFAGVRWIDAAEQ